MYSIEKTYKSSDSFRFFKLERAVENIPLVSILVASLYRNLQLVEANENTSNGYGQILYKSLNSSLEIGGLFTNEELIQLFNTSLSVPISESQLKQKKFWISPLVPEIGNYGLSVRNTEKSAWNPGRFILEIIANYSSGIEEFIEVLELLYSALKVSSNDNDIWSICVKNEFDHISKNLDIQSLDVFNEIYFRDFFLNNSAQKKLLYRSDYAKNTIVDLRNICSLKNRLTRQKWIGFLEGYIRLTIFNHITYTLNFSRNYFYLIREKLNKRHMKIVPEDLEIFLNLGYNINDIRIKVGTSRKQYIRDHVESFAYHNALIGGLFEHCNLGNFVDFESEDEFIHITQRVIGFIQTEQNLEEFQVKFQSDNELELSNLNEDFSSFKNIKESLGYLCSKKGSSREKFISDVNYLFDKNGPSLNSPYTMKISSGLISTLTSLIFLRKKDSNSFISGLEFIKGLNDFNIQLSINDISSGEIKDTMLSLGIVIDCPDTEGGVLIIKPAWIKNI